MTKVKPSRINITWTPWVGKVLAYVSETEFAWVDGWSISNEPYSIDRATDETNGASRKSLYDKIESMDVGIQNSAWTPTVWTTYTAWTNWWSVNNFDIDPVFTANKAGDFTLVVTKRHNWTSQNLSWAITKNWIDIANVSWIVDTVTTQSINITGILPWDVIWIRVDNYNSLTCRGDITVRFEYTPVTTWRLTNI